MYPVESSLHVGKPRLELANHIRIGSNAKAYAIHHSGKPHIRFRKHVDVRAHPRNNVLELAFAKITHGPPRPRVDESEHLLPNVSVRTLGNVEIRHSSIERGVDPAVT